MKLILSKAIINRLLSRYNSLISISNYFWINPLCIHKIPILIAIRCISNLENNYIKS